jgi:polysaccharide export outer membrane protein
VALAGGYTYRANEDFAVVERKQGDHIVTGRAAPDTPILPDDVIRVPERYY